jgi:hypothetical protein
MKLFKCVAVSPYKLSTPTDAGDSKMLTLNLLLQIFHGTWIWQPERCTPAGEPRVGTREG